MIYGSAWKYVLVIAFLMPLGHLIAIKWHNLLFGMESWEYSGCKYDNEMNWEQGGVINEWFYPVNN